MHARMLSIWVAAVGGGCCNITHKIVNNGLVNSFGMRTKPFNQSFLHFCFGLGHFVCMCMCMFDRDGGGGWLLKFVEMGQSARTQGWLQVWGGRHNGTRRHSEVHLLINLSLRSNTHCRLTKKKGQIKGSGVRWMIGTFFTNQKQKKNSIH